jgi:hypothetical protein
VVAQDGNLDMVTDAGTTGGGEMKPVRRLFDSLSAYPFRERLPLALAWVCVTAWTGRDLWHFAQVDEYVEEGAFFLCLLCTWKGRPFWFFLGIATGAFLLGSLRISRSDLGFPYLAGLLVMAVVLVLLRQWRSTSAVRS